MQGTLGKEIVTGRKWLRRPYRQLIAVHLDQAIAPFTERI